MPGASRATVITYINPVVATLLGVVVLREHLGVGGFSPSRSFCSARGWRRAAPPAAAR